MQVRKISKYSSKIHSFLVATLFWVTYVVDTFLTLTALLVFQLSDYLDYHPRDNSKILLLDKEVKTIQNKVILYLYLLISYSFLAVGLAWLFKPHFSKFLQRIQKETAEITPLGSRANQSESTTLSSQNNERTQNTTHGRTPSEQRAYEESRKKKIEKQLNIPDFIYKQSATFFRRILPKREDKLKKMFQASKKKKAPVVSISSRHLHSSVGSSKILMPFDRIDLEKEKIVRENGRRGLRPVASEMKFESMSKNVVTNLNDEHGFGGQNGNGEKRLKNSSSQPIFVRKTIKNDQNSLNFDESEVSKNAFEINLNETTLPKQAKKSVKKKQPNIPKLQDLKKDPKKALGLKKFNL